MEIKKTTNKSDKNNDGLKASTADLIANRYKRIHFDEEKLEELANSIRKNGIIQPIAVEDKLDPKV